MTEFAARLAGISKRFGRVQALRDATLEVRPGEVHGVLGENGAGKTTLLGILGGLSAPDAGTVEVAGKAYTLRTPRDAWAVGVGLVQQHFALVPPLTVLENLALGRSRKMPELESDAEALMARTGLEVPLDAPVAFLGVGSRQRVEILKALLRRPRVLVLDEPTAVLAPAEVDALFRLLRELAGQGEAVVLVAHKLDEVLSVADRVTVLRSGSTVLTAPVADVDAPTLIRAMVGSDSADPAAVGHGVGGGPGMGGESGMRRADTAGAAPEPAISPVVAELTGVRVRGTRGEWAVNGASLQVRRGEVVGVAGVEGNGQRELARVLARRIAPDEGTVRLPDQVAYVPQDRQGEGLVADFDLTANVALALHDHPGYARGPWLRWGALRQRTAELLDRFDVRAAGPGVAAATLSGGNQQRVVVARELSLERELVVAESPTRGLDVAAAAFVHGELTRLASSPGGPGVVLVSTDLDEILALSHRIFVMVRGRLVEVPADAHTREGVGRLMLAATHE